MVIKKTNNHQILARMCSDWHAQTIAGYINRTTPMEKKICWLPIKLKMYLPMTQQFHSQYLTQENKNTHPQKTCPRMFIATLCIIPNSP